MQSTLSRPLSTTSLPSDPLSYSSTAQTEVYPSTLLAAFATVPDPRRRQGARFALSAVLALVVSAILSNHLSVLAIAEWGKSQGCDLLKSLGFSKGITPHQSTLHRLLGRLDPKALSVALSAHFVLFAKPKDSASPPPRASQAVSIDGKAQRGRLAFDSSGGPVHALAAYLHGQGIVLAQEPIGEANQTVSDGSTDKAQAELSVAPSLIKRIDWQGRVLTGDALFCQRSLCKQVAESGGDYLLTVKQNQPRIYEDIRLLFNPPSGLALPLDDRRAARTVDHGHGRRYDTRVLVASSDLVGYSDWPNLAQVFSIERTWREKGKTRQEISFSAKS